MYGIFCKSGSDPSHNGSILRLILALLAVIVSGCATNDGSSNTAVDVLSTDFGVIPDPADVPDIAMDTATVAVDTTNTAGEVSSPDVAQTPQHDSTTADTASELGDAPDCAANTECDPDDLSSPDQDTGSTTPQPQSCAALGECLGQYGCDCQLGNNCPPAGSLEFESCQAKCAKQPACVESCLQTLEPITYDRFVALQACAEAHCADTQGDSANQICLKTKCLNEYAACYHVGQQPCIWLFTECAIECKTIECLDKCELQLSADAYVAMVKWDGCRFGLCDENNDGKLDSNTCNTLLAYTACAQDALSCMSPAFQGNSSCWTAVSCLGECADWTDQSCLSACLRTKPDDAAALGDVLVCVVAHCGTADHELTPSCLTDALAGPCVTPAGGCK